MKALLINDKGVEPILGVGRDGLETALKSLYDEEGSIVAFVPIHMGGMLVAWESKSDGYMEFIAEEVEIHE